MYAGGGLLTYALNVLGYILPVSVAFHLRNLLECFKKLNLINRLCLIIQSLGIFLTLYTQMYHQGGIATVINYHVGTSLREVHGLQSAPPVFLGGFTFPGKNRGTACSGNGCCSVVLG